jgi:hypothetical protein
MPWVHIGFHRKEEFWCGSVHSCYKRENETLRLGWWNWKGKGREESMETGEDFLAVLEFELRALFLLGRCSTAWVTSLALFTSVILDMGPLFPRPAWTTVLPFYTSHHHWDDGRVSPCPAFSHWDGGLTNFFLPGLAWNLSPPNLSLLCSLGWQVHALLLLRWGLGAIFSLTGLELQSSQSETLK